MTSIIIAILIFCLLVVFHEFGHFILAKKNGIYVVEFSIGMGPRLFSFKKGETRYSIKLLPIGGSCMMLGEDEETDSVYYDEILGELNENATEEEKQLRHEKIEELKQRTFNQKSVWGRIAVVLAGPVFNFILAFLLSLVVVGNVGGDPAYITGVTQNSPAEEAGLKEGDLIVSYDGASIDVGREIYVEQYLGSVSAGDSVEIVYEREGEKHKTTVVPVAVDQYIIGIQYYTGEGEAVLSATVKDGPAQKAGLKEGDIITKINGTQINSADELDEYMDNYEHDGEALTFNYLRDGREYEVEITPQKQTYTSIGFSYNLAREKQDLIGTIKYSFKEVKYQISTVIKSIKSLFAGRVSTDEMSGPVGIVSVISDTYEQSKQSGLKYTILNMLNISIMLSANLGVMNLLPIPALDGGRLLFLFVEVIRRKRIPQEKEAFVHLIGMALLMLLMVFLIFNDVSKLL